jgi:hypothetical protein
LHTLVPLHDYPYPGADAFVDELYTTVLMNDGSWHLDSMTVYLEVAAETPSLRDGEMRWQQLNQ